MTISDHPGGKLILDPILSIFFPDCTQLLTRQVEFSVIKKSFVIIRFVEQEIVDSLNSNDLHKRS